MPELQLYQEVGDFLQQLADDNSWLNPRLKKPAKVFISANTIYLHAIDVLSSRPDETVIVELRLERHHYYKVLVVTRFAIKGEGVVPGYFVLSQQGKKQAVTFEDLNHKDLSQFWEVVSVEDLKRLFREHDSLTEGRGERPIFLLDKYPCH
jgi:hypothetical protein